MITALSVGFGGIGAIVGIYSLYRQRQTRQQMNRVQEQMDKKEDLQELAEDLQSLKENLQLFHDGLSKPEESIDTWTQLMDLGRNILAYKHYSGRVPRVQVEEIVIRTNDDTEDYRNMKQVKRLLDIGCYPTFRIEPNVEDDAKHLIWGIHFAHPLLNVNVIYNSVEQVSRYEGLVSQFDQDLVIESEALVDEIIESILDHVTENSEGKKFGPSNYNDINDLSRDIYHFFVYYDDIDEDLEELSALIDRIEDLRTTAVETSYS